LQKSLAVIPAKAGIQSFQDVLAPGFRRVTVLLSFARTSLENASDDTTRDRIIQEVLLGASFGGNQGLMRFALDRGAEINAKGFLEETALMEAARSGNADAIRFLLTESADVQLQDESGNTALSWAARSESTTAVQLWIDAGSDIPSPKQRMSRKRHPA